ncbi:hypothetical protein BDP27DRAFT_458486 [Rhodocollybia butyracea]|uniref:Uncharacterized protein n=1 Tax=Rhodocollybia butyracea TaxID=206335 RepID=A0A9P5UB61_9AGAR|nr:hypothetical protein BDP27DRAFT_458486 [Rhodocollybia butyracea]
MVLHECSFGDFIRIFANSSLWIFRVYRWLQDMPSPPEFLDNGFETEGKNYIVHSFQSTVFGLSTYSFSDRNSGRTYLQSPTTSCNSTSVECSVPFLTALYL